MIKVHELETENMDLSPYIVRHSADEVYIYKALNNNPLRLGIYYPSTYDKQNKYPVFLFIHGGGWSSHKIFSDQKEWAGDYLGFLARYYAEKGYISVSIDYRLLRIEGEERGQVKGYQLPDLIEDCLDAIRFLKEKENEIGLDFTRSVILGESAGGYLAAVLATFQHEFKKDIKKAILVNAIVDMTDSFWGRYCPKGMEYTSISPVHQIDNNTPETLLIHGIDDSIVEPWHSQMFYDGMQIHKRTCELHWIKNTDHAFLLAEFMIENKTSLNATEKAIGIIDDFLNDKNA